jgi:hypothetical protein
MNVPLKIIFLSQVPLYLLTQISSRLNFPHPNPLPHGEREFLKHVSRPVTTPVNFHSFFVPIAVGMTVSSEKNSFLESSIY